jgi:hypothetical protein
MAALDPSSIQSLGSIAATQSLVNAQQAQAPQGGTAAGNFNGTIGDLQKNYPEVYQKLVLQSIAYQICQQAQSQNDRYVEKIKEDSDES